MLFAIDPRPFERALEQAQAELFAATTKVENANLDVARGQPLIERKIISDKTFDDRKNLMRDAQATVKVAEAKVKSAELDLSFATIASPITGRISRTLVTAGNWISAGSVVRRHAADHHRQPGPDLHLLRRQREQLHQVQAPGRARREGRRRRRGRAGRDALPDERGFPHKGGSTSSTTVSTRAPAR